MAEGMEFAAAPRPPRWGGGSGDPGEPLGIYEEAVTATRETRPLIRELAPQAVIADILTLGPSLAAELEGVRFGTLVPHLDPRPSPGLPIFSSGARMSLTAVGRALWRLGDRAVCTGLQRGRTDLNRTREQVGLAPVERLYGGISARLVLVATFPQLEYPRPWGRETHVVGPLIWEPAGGEVALPPGEGALVLIAPSTAQDPEQVLLRAALRGLADAPVRVIASGNRREEAEPPSVPGNAVLVDWASYGQTMPLCAVVVTHAGHGTLARALALGRPVVACPAAGDMNENAARLDWTGAGVRLPRRFIGPRPLRLAVERILGDPRFSHRARELAAWASLRDGAERAADLVESLARG